MNTIKNDIPEDFLDDSSLLTADVFDRNCNIFVHG